MKKLFAKVLGPGALAFPTWAYAVFFFIVPVALVVFYSFGYKPDQFTPVATDHLSFDRYGEVFTGAVLHTLGATVRIAVLGTALCLLISVPFTYWLAVKVPPQRRGLLLAIVMIPFWTNFLVRTLGWQIMLSPNGFLSHWLQRLDLIDSPLSILYTRTAVQIGVVYNYLPLMILPLFVAMDAAGRQLREASYDLGAGRWSTFFRVTMPLAMPGIISGCLLVFIPLNGDYVTASVLGGAHGSMIGQIIANQFNTAQDWAMGAAMAVSLIFVTAAIVGVAGFFFWLGRVIFNRATRVDLREVRA